MTPPASRPPLGLVSVLDASVDALLFGSAGWLRVPAGGNIAADWLSRKECYRLHVDVTAGHELELELAHAGEPDLAARLRGAT